MSADVFIATRVTAETKERFAAVARRQGLSQSVLLKRLITATLLSAETPNLNFDEAPKPLPSSGKISVRLQPNDLLLLRERAAARGMPSSTYVTFLLRSNRTRKKFESRSSTAASWNLTPFLHGGMKEGGLGGRGFERPHLWIVE
jgi:hypothetical protein